MKKNLSKQTWRLDLSVITGLLGAFSLAATLSPVSDKSHPVNVVIWDLFFLISMAVVWGFQVRYWHCVSLVRADGSSIRKRSGLLLVLAVVVCVRIFQLNTFPRWDSETYFTSLMKGCQAFDFSLKSYIKFYRLAGHTSLGYALILAIGGFLTPHRIIGVQLANLILVMLWVVALYGILRKLYPTLREYLLCIFVLFVAMEPTFSGLFFGISLDFGLCLLCVFMLWAHLYKHHLMFMFLCLMIAQTKEVGVIFLAGYGLGCLVTKLISCAQGRTEVKKIFRDPFLWMLLATGLLMIIYFAGVHLSKEMKIWGNGIQLQNQETSVNYFAVDYSYILLKLKTVFLLNFGWILLPLNVFFYIIRWRRKGRLIRTERPVNEALAGYYTGLLMLLLFSCVYITYNNPRYVMPLKIGLSILTVCNAVEFIGNKIILTVIFLGIVVLNGAETFITIDPVTMECFTRIDTDNKIGMVHTGWKKKKSLIADIATYNYQISFLDKAYDRMLSEVDYNEDMTILIGGKTSARAAFIDGMKEKLYWDKDNHCRSFRYTDHSCEINVMMAQDLPEREAELPEKAVLVWTPLFGDDEDTVVSQVDGLYTIGGSHEVAIIYQGSIRYYMLTRING